MLRAAAQPATVNMPRRPAPWWVCAYAVPFVAYFGLLVWCDVLRPEPEGLTLAFGETLTVAREDAKGTTQKAPPVTPGSAADRAGLRPGDRIVAVNGQRIGASKMDWVAVTSNVEFGAPVALDLVRDGRPLRAVLVFSPQDPWRHWTTREGLDLAFARLVQFVTLTLGFLLLVRRPGDPVARLGAWLLGSVSVFSVVPPYRIDAVWRGLWWPIGGLLWLPLVSSLLVSALLLSFFLVFPVRRVLPRAAVAAVWLPALAAAAPFVRYRMTTVYSPASMFGVQHRFGLLLAVSMLYVCATLVCIAWSYRRIPDETERRRLRVLLAGVILGSPAAGAIVVGWWRAESLTLFSPTAMGWLAPLLVATPASFAYAILRHRLFDVRLIIRQGVRYALARRLLQSLVPTLLLVMALDLYLHRTQSMGEVLAARATPYLVLSAAALLAQFRRNRWLLALDRRFFRERYDAQRLLRQVADDIRDAGSIERVAGRVVEQIELALHPRFATLLLKAEGSEEYRPLASSPRGAGPERLPADAKLLALARVLRRPLEIAVGETPSLSGQLTIEELQVATASGIELLVPIVSPGAGPKAFIALGERRSEEPYPREDQDLLQAIAGTLGLLLSRAGTPGVGLRECPSCGACCDETAVSCPADAAPLVRMNLPRVLIARYRLEQRLGRGGMGTVYVARDLGLEREVAVKVLREDLAGEPDAVRRFEAEARTAASFSHPNVVTVHDYGVTGGGRGFLVMERLHGRTLRVEMERSRGLPPARALQILQGVCAAVEAAHRRQLVHRDLKPENVFLAEVEGSGVAKVLDFGIAKPVVPAAPGRRDTAAGVIVGTPEYMAPEQLRGEESTAASDLWALGIMACEMLTGEHPFSALVVRGTAPSLPVEHTEALLRPFHGFDAAFGPFFERALAIDPDCRFASAHEFWLGLERAVLEGERS